MLVEASAVTWAVSTRQAHTLVLVPFMGSMKLTPFLSGLQIETESPCAQIHSVSQVLGRMLRKQKLSICALDPRGLSQPHTSLSSPGFVLCPEAGDLGKLGASLSLDTAP